MNKSLIVLPLALLISCTSPNSQTEETFKAEIQMQQSIAEKNKQSVRAFFQAIERESVEELLALFSEEGRHVNPYASGLFPEGANGKEEIRDYWTPVFPNFDGMQFPIEEIYAMENPNLVYVKYKGKIKLKGDAGYYENNYYSTFKFDESGLITEYVEIFNPILAARAFGLTDKIK